MLRTCRDSRLASVAAALFARRRGRRLLAPGRGVLGSHNALPEGWAAAGRRVLIAKSSGHCHCHCHSRVSATAADFGFELRCPELQL